MKLLASYPGSSTVEEPGYEAMKQWLSVNSNKTNVQSLLIETHQG